MHRRPAIGRRNFLFVGSHPGGERATIAYSILGTCCLLGLNPVAYLADIVPTLARGIERDDIAALMPKAWSLAHPEAALARRGCLRAKSVEAVHRRSCGPASAYSLKVVVEAELSGDGQVDWVVWLLDEATTSSYRDCRTLIIRNAAASGPLHAMDLWTETDLSDDPTNVSQGDTMPE